MPRVWRRFKNPGQLQQQQFLVGQPRARRLQLRVRAREMQAAQGLRRGEQAALGHQLGGHGVGRLVGVRFDRGVRQLAHEALREALGQRVDRRQARDVDAPALVGQRVVLVDLISRMPAGPGRRGPTTHRSRPRPPRA